MHVKIAGRFKLSAVQILALGFAAVILIGAILLSMPFSTNSGQATDFLDSLFTSTSAVCVTGLVTLDTATHWNYVGKTIIIVLIQVGGLGFMSFTTLFAVLVGKRITLKERLLLRESLNAFGIQGLVKLMRYIFGFTFLVEGLGALLLSTQFIPQFGFAKGLYYSIWTAISAFCNAGFDLMGGVSGKFSSLTAYADNPVIIYTISALIIIGGLGFAIWSEFYNYKERKKLSLHAKVVLVVTAILLFGGAILMFIFEYSNPQTLGPMSLGEKINNAFFASVTTRTAGFNTISTDGMTLAGKFITVLLMFVGGSPGSTAGGLKTATLGILAVTLISIVKGRDDVEIFKKRLSKETVYKAFAIFFLSLCLVLTVIILLCATQPGKSFMSIVYESVSAYGTVGLSLGLTQQLNSIGKVIILITMYLGRVGPMTVILALTSKVQKNKKVGIKYPEDKILIG